MYYRNRYYHPRFSRFISEDPIGLAGGDNAYRYVDARPTSLLDPLGYAGKDKWWGRNDQSFRDWVHKEKFAEGRKRDFSREEMDRFWEEWEEMEKKERGKGGKSSRGGKLRCPVPFIVCPTCDFLLPRPEEEASRVPDA
jgi:uncharacterized protein RhaS with RHS repeats